MTTKTCNNGTWMIQNQICVNDLKGVRLLSWLQTKGSRSINTELFFPVQVSLSILLGRRRLWWALRLWLQAACWAFRSRAEANWKTAVWTVVKDLVMKTTVVLVASLAVAGAPVKTCNAPTVRKKMDVQVIIFLGNNSSCLLLAVQFVGAKENSFKSQQLLWLFGWLSILFQPLWEYRQWKTMDCTRFCLLASILLSLKCTF